MQHEILADDLDFPEGPVWLPDNSVAFVEVSGQRVSRVAQDGTKCTVAEVPGSPNGLAVGPDGALYVCNAGGSGWTKSPEGYPRAFDDPQKYIGGSIQRIDPKSGTLTTLYSECDGIPLATPNDLVFDRNGGLWFTDFGRRRGRSMDVCGVYYCRIDEHFIKEAAHPFIGANGISLSPDDKLLYVAETTSGRIWEFEVLGPAKLSKEDWRHPTGGRPVYTLQGINRPDSIGIEANGNICIGTLRTGAITVVSPRGELIELIRYPDVNVTNICFGGEEMMDAYVTLSATGKLARSRWSRPGLRLPYTDRYQIRDGDNRSSQRMKRDQ